MSTNEPLIRAGARGTGPPAPSSLCSSPAPRRLESAARSTQRPHSFLCTPAPVTRFPCSLARLSASPPGLVAPQRTLPGRTQSRWTAAASPELATRPHQYPSTQLMPAPSRARDERRAAECHAGETTVSALHRDDSAAAPPCSSTMLLANCKRPSLAKRAGLLMLSSLLVPLAAAADCISLSSSTSCPAFKDSQVSTSDGLVATL